MRGVFGLLSLLICALIIAYLWSIYGTQGISSSRPMIKQAQQIAGQSEDGTPAINSIKVEPMWDPARHFGKLLVTEVQSGGAMEKFYGVQKGDEISGFGQLQVRDFSDDLASATAMLADAYQRSQPLLVTRHGTELSLPDPKAASTAGQSIQNQVDQITKPPR